ncbi:MAG: polysaccharide pyruvyl transferase family protein [Bacteroidales bacterium]|nr:polysaccharide pyruvyl transferase family protein [Bacteroidales bacterium]
MKIVLSGVETNNKGAELMLYAILQEVERKCPDAVVYVEPNSVKQGLSYLKTKQKLKEKPIGKVVKICSKFHVYGIAYRLKIPTMLMEDVYPIKGADFFLDGAGFHFSDQWNYPDSYIERKKRLWEGTKRNGTKIVFLPQAFGSFEKPQSLKYLGYASEYADIIMAREQQSFDYLSKSGVVDMKKVRLFPDFTSLVEGVFPIEYANLRNSICIIPNYNMIESGTISIEDYLSLLTSFINSARNKGIESYILNHEGIKDEKLAYMCRKKLDNNIDVVTGLNALEVKGLIASSYMVISSRFHGVVSSLNSCVPCLATSWSHKYEELYNDYGICEGVLPLGDINKAIEKMDVLLDKEANYAMRKHLEKEIGIIQDKNREMWNVVWNT